jgi:hypothetical protein
MQPGALPLAPGRITQFALPVSGVVVSLSHPTGIEDLLLVECGDDDDSAALALARRLAWAEDGSEIAWAGLAPTDLDVLVLRLRQALLGDRIASDLRCRSDGCGSRVDIAFSIEDYLAHHHPKPPEPRGRGRMWRVLACTDEPSWFTLAPDTPESAHAAARFRLPTVADQIQAARQHDPEAALARVCIRPERIAAPLRRRVEAAMQAMAPALAGELGGRCPDCRATVAARFDPRRYCLRELRDRARYIYEDVDVLARRYHWTEDSILAMPNARRAGYVEFALAGGSA